MTRKRNRGNSARTNDVAACKARRRLGSPGDLVS